jgi:cytochrome c-type biogenesis protein CcmH/NrfF
MSWWIVLVVVVVLGALAWWSSRRRQRNGVNDASVQRTRSSRNNEGRGSEYLGGGPL